MLTDHLSISAFDMMTLNKVYKLSVLKQRNSWRRWGIRKCNSLALATASLSTPANTVVKCAGFLALFCKAHLIPGRAAPAAQPHTELITINVVPCSFKELSTSAGVFNS